MKFRDFNIIYYLFIFFIPLEYFNPFSSIISLSITKMLGFLVVLVFLFDRRYRKKTSLRRINYWIFTLITIFIVSIFSARSINDFIEIDFPIITTLLLNLVMFLIYIKIFQSSDSSNYLRSYLFSNFIVASTFILNIGTTEGMIINGIERYGHLGANSNLLAMWFSSSILIAIYLVPKERKGLIQIFYLIGIGILFLAILKTASRGALLGLLISLIILIIYKLFNTKELSFGYVIIGIAAIMIGYNALLSSELFMYRISQTYVDKNISSRDILFDVSIDLILNKPIFGYGISGVVETLPRSLRGFTNQYINDPHNAFLWVFLAGGISAFISFCMFIISGYRISFQKMSLGSILPLLLLVFITASFLKGGGVITQKYAWFLFSFIYAENLLNENSNSPSRK